MPNSSAERREDCVEDLDGRRVVSKMGAAVFVTEEHLPDELRGRLQKCTEPVPSPEYHELVRMTCIRGLARGGLALLAEAAQAGTLPVSSVSSLVSSAGDALEMAGHQEGAEALRTWHERLVEANVVLQGLVASCKALWPNDTHLLMAVDQVAEAWPDLPAASAIVGLQGGASPAFSQVPSTLLVVSPALSLLGKSSAFRALWWHEGCGAGRFEPAELQLSAIAWAGFYSSLQAPEASELPLPALEPVLGRLQDAEELRLMAVTGSTLQLSDGKIVAWGSSDPSAEWEAAAAELARKLWHSLSVKHSHSALEKTLSGLREKLLDEKTGQKEADDVLDVLVKLQAAFQSWETTALKNHGPIGTLTAQIDARLLIHPEAMMTSMLTSFEMLQWLRKMPDDSDYLVRIEVALNRSEMEVPAELWLAEEGRVDESKLSALTAVRTTFHDLIYRPKSRFSTLDALLESLSALEHSTEISGLVEALDFAFSLLGPLSELLGGKDAALARMLQMLKPTSCARWVLCYPRLASPSLSPTDDKAQEEEEETLAQTPAEARMLYLMLSSPGWKLVTCEDAAQASAPQRLVEILDFQASVTLAASTFDAAFGQVRTFNEQIGLVRLAAAVLDDLRVAGHPDYQEIHVEWPLSLGLSEMKSQLHALRERQAIS
eukprot:s1411_g13.t2